MESDTSIFCVPSLSEGLRKGLRSFVCLLFSLFFFILVIVALPVKSRRPPSWQENTQLREHVDAVVEQAEAGVARFCRLYWPSDVHGKRFGQFGSLFGYFQTPFAHAMYLQGAQEDWEPQIRWRDERYEAMTWIS